MFAKVLVLLSASSFPALLIADSSPNVDIPGVNCDIDVVRLARDGEVQRKLNMNGPQRADLELASRILDERIRDAIKEIKTAREFAAATRKLGAIRNDYLAKQREMEKDLPKILDPRQLEQLHATRFKLLGPAAIFSEELEQRFQLTATQKDEMGRIRDAWWKAIKSIKRPAGISESEFLKTGAYAQVDGLLTATQREKLTELTNAAIDLGDSTVPENAIVRRRDVIIGSPITRTTWLRMAAHPLIAAELRLSEKQAEALKKVIEEVRGFHDEVVFVAGEIPRRDSPALSILISRSTRHQNAFANLGSEIERKALDALDKENLDILRGLRLSAHGPAEVFNPALREYFGITKEQEVAVDNLIDETLAAKGSIEQKLAVAVALNEKMLAIFTKEQRAKFDKLKRSSISKPLQQAVLSTIF
jgi:hypothetical protein